MVFIVTEKSPVVVLALVFCFYLYLKVLICMVKVPNWIWPSWIVVENASVKLKYTVDLVLLLKQSKQLLSESLIFYLVNFYSHKIT